MRTLADSLGELSIEDLIAAVENAQVDLKELKDSASVDFMATEQQTRDWLEACLSEFRTRLEHGDADESWRLRLDPDDALIREMLKTEYNIECGKYKAPLL